MFKNPTSAPTKELSAPVEQAELPLPYERPELAANENPQELLEPATLPELKGDYQDILGLPDGELEGEGLA